MRRMSPQAKLAVSGCPLCRRKVLPVLNIWRTHPRRCRTEARRLILETRGARGSALVRSFFRVLRFDGSMKINMGVLRCETTTLHPHQGVDGNRLGENTCVFTIRTLQGGVLDLAMVPNERKQNPCMSLRRWRARSRLPNGKACVGWLSTASLGRFLFCDSCFSWTAWSRV